MTGGARGIGRSICQMLALHGARVAINYERNEQAARETLDLIKGAGADAMIVQADVSDEGQVGRMTPAVRAFVESLLVQMDQTQARMQAEVDEPKAQVKKLTPQNSSVPPATVHPHARPAAKPTRKPKAKKPRGGQKGHQRTIRELVPVERCTEVVPRHPTQCRRCGEGLTGFDTEPLRHQVWELPEIEPLITEYQRHRLTCECCGTATCAELPPGVPTGQFGARLLAFTALLMGHFRQSQRRAALFLTDLLNMPCCPAALLPGIHREHAEPCGRSVGTTLRRSQKPIGT